MKLSQADKLALLLMWNDHVAAQLEAYDVTRFTRAGLAARGLATFKGFVPRDGAAPLHLWGLTKAGRDAIGPFRDELLKILAG